MTATIRTFTEADRAAVIALWERCGLTRPWNNPGLDIDRKVAESPELFFVAEHDDGAVVGVMMAGYDGHRGWLNYLGVDPKLRRSGLGQSLVRAGELALAELGCPKVNLQIRQENAGAVRFYETQGYSTDAVLSMGKRLVPDT